MLTEQQVLKRIVMIEDPRFTSGKRPWFGQLPDGLSGDFSFAVMGDRCGMTTEGVFEKALEMLKDLKPEFALFVGDMIEGYWKDAVSAHEEWDEMDSKIQSCGIPFFPTIGNHDYGNSVMADVWSERKGMDYYAFRVGDVLFLSINTESTPDELPDEVVDIIKRVTDNFKRDPGNSREHLKLFAEISPELLQSMSAMKMSIGEEQFAFFEQVLADNQDVTWTFVNMHKPGWKIGSEEFNRLERMLADRPYTIFSGHLHELEYTREENRELIQFGRTGGLAHGDAENGAQANMVLWVTMRHGVPTYRVIHLDGVQDISGYPPKRDAHSRGE
jgi:3',5'-cyclic AMP phosphodiesterase CpdA